MGKHWAVVIGAAAVGVMALGAQTAASSTVEPVDSTPPDLQVSAKKNQSLRQGAPNKHRCVENGWCGPHVKVNASCGDEECSARAKGHLIIRQGKIPGVDTGRPGQFKRYELKPESTNLAPENPRDPLVLKLTKKARKKASNALDEGKNVQAKVIVRATDAAGNVARAVRMVRLVE
jgi:hypothetical protein